MNIVYTIDSHFLPQTAAAVTSVCENNADVREISFYILCLGVAEADKVRMADHIAGFGGEGRERRAIFIDLDRMETYFDFAFDTSGWNPIVLSRLILDRLLPPSLDRVLYLDGDTMVRRSLSSLWATDMGACPLGACIEPTCTKERKASLGLSGLPYYNAGVLLIDMHAFRRERVGETILAYYRKNGGHLFANDQDAINGSLKERIFSLPVSYNYHNTYDFYSTRFLQKICDYPLLVREIEEAKKNPHIVHFLGEERPWREGNTHRFRDEYLSYLSKTPWKGQGIETGWKTYFLCWRLFNLITRHLPALRYGIITRLIPVMLEHRNKKRTA